jgi:hypothetical protein
MPLPRTEVDGSRDAAADHAEALQSLLEQSGVPYLSEASAKFRPGAWSTRRRLFSVSTEAAPVDALVPRLGSVLTGLGMLTADRDAFLAPLQERASGTAPPHFLHLGVEDARCKAYWEAEPPVAGRIAARHVMYRAWKWFHGEASTCSDYVMLPSARRAGQAIEEALSRQAVSPLHDVLEQLQVSFALAHKAWPPLTVRVEETHQGRMTGRDSLNLHLHRAGLPLGTLAGALFALSRDWQATPRAALVEWMAAHGDQTLSNLSFGQGADGKPFLTCYHGTRRHLPHHTEPPRRSDRIPGIRGRAASEAAPTHPST